MLKHIKALRFLRVISFVMSAIFFALSLAAKGGRHEFLYFVFCVIDSRLSYE